MFTMSRKHRHVAIFTATVAVNIAPSPDRSPAPHHLTAITNPNPNPPAGSLFHTTSTTSCREVIHYVYSP